VTSVIIIATLIKISFGISFLIIYFIIVIVG